MVLLENNFNYKNFTMITVTTLFPVYFICCNRTEVSRYFQLAFNLPEPQVRSCSKTQNATVHLQPPLYTTPLLKLLPQEKDHPKPMFSFTSLKLLKNATIDLSGWHLLRGGNDSIILSFHFCTFCMSFPHPINAFLCSPRGISKLPLKKLLLPFFNNWSSSFHIQYAHYFFPIYQRFHFPHFL